MQTDLNVNWPETNWYLEAARILIPGLITVIVGLWITRSNERFKSELLIQSTKFQLNHPKRVAAAEELAPLLANVEKVISRLLFDSIGTLIKTGTAERKILDELQVHITKLSEGVDRHELLFDIHFRTSLSQIIIGVCKFGFEVKLLLNRIPKPNPLLGPDGGELKESAFEIQRQIKEIQEQFRTILAS